MKVLLLLLFSLTGLAVAAERQNVLLICVDDLRPELNCYGVDYIHSPHIDSLAARGRLFQHHYVQAPTCGASRYALLTGRYGPTGNQALFQRAPEAASSPPSLPAHLRRHGYTTVSVGKVSHHPGGRGGKNWDDPEKLEMPLSWDRHLLPAGKWRHPRGWMHGLANGVIRDDIEKHDVFEAFDGPDSAYPDGPSVEEALRQLELLAKDEKPFFLAAGILRPHLPFGAPAKYLELYKDAELPPIPHPEKPAGQTTWHKSGEFMRYHRWGKNPNEDAEFADRVRLHYAACVSYADAQVGRLLARLDELGLRGETIVVLWGDHGWHLGEHAIWGKHSLFEESLRSPLIISSPGMVKPGVATASLVESIDVYPTLCELTGLTTPGALHGRSLVPLLTDPSAGGHPAISYHGAASTIRTGTHRLILHRNGHTELYDHTTKDGETVNLADKHPELVEKLSAILKSRLDLR